MKEKALGVWGRLGVPGVTGVPPPPRLSASLGPSPCLLPVSGDALLLLAEFLKIFVREAAARGVRQAQAEDLSAVDVEHVEKVLPQLLLDF
uniref:Centromere protein X n=1 Tax=Ornithorhynchus anatinus TaxID=9258 RepID=A0A6I8NQ57_ORNAN